MKQIRLFLLFLMIFSAPFFSSSANALEEGDRAPAFTASSTQGVSFLWQPMPARKMSFWPCTSPYSPLSE